MSKPKPAAKKSAPAKKPAPKAKPAPKPSVKPAAKVPAKPAPKVAAKAPAKPVVKAKEPPAPVPERTLLKPLNRVPQFTAGASLAPLTGPVDPNKPKGITIVNNKTAKRPKPPKKVFEMPQLGAPLFGAGKKWKPLIQSGPNAPKAGKNGIDPATLKGKTPFNKKELDHYKQILLRKRAELMGDVENMEGAALKENSGSLSHLPQHVAEAGSDAYDQSLALDIADVDRKLIKEIDEAIGRIADASYGLCQVTGKAINKERLEELPWTRYSIEAAREHEKRTFFVPRKTASAGED
ncbi:MAG TPA: TraR/DksA C4-type zinc finger protein [Phycisphaerales bacterium]|nr:TraR/DksA C4-type zinc finger protein [Phycisphaerales bacterium]